MPKYRRSVPVGNRPITSMGIAQARLPGGGSINLMRVMQTNACSLSCGYCPTYCGGKVPRATVSPEEIATTFMDVNRKGLAQGLFLTSGVPGPRHARHRPDARHARGAAPARGLLRLHPRQAAPRRRDRAGRGRRAPGHADLGQPRGADRRPREPAGEGEEPHGRSAAQAGAGGAALPRGSRGRRTGAAGQHHDAVRGRRRRRERSGSASARGASGAPAAAPPRALQRLPAGRGTPFEGFAPTPAARESRLYQAEHLLREYGFGVEELAFESGGNLPLEHDPKTAWALAHPERFPLEITRAPLELLLRIPGLGPKAARTIVDTRRRAVLRGLADLRRIGVDTVRAAYYLTLHGRRLAATPAPQQLSLFAPGEHLTQAPFRTPVPPCAYR